MGEKTLERRLVEECKKRGWHALKFSSGVETGFPDRLILFPGGWVSFVELKSEGKKLRPLQTRRFIELRQMGFQVWLVNSIETLNQFLNVSDEIYPAQLPE